MAVRIDAAADKLERTLDLPAGAFTLMGWFYITNDRAATTTFLGLGTVESQFYSVGIDSALKLQIYDGNTFPSGSTVLATGTWYHAALTRASGDDQTLTGYLDGASEVTISNSRNLTTRTFMDVGNDIDSEWLDGRAKAVKIWDAVLTQAEIQQEMRTIRPHRFANLHGFWPLFPGSGERLRDYSGNGRDWTEGGTLTDEDPPPLSWGAPVLFLPFAGGGPGVAYHGRFLLLGIG